MAVSEEGDLIGEDFPQKIFAGSINWFQ